jgi:hypothetical protein
VQFPFLKVVERFTATEINKTIVRRPRFDVAVSALYITESAGVQPQCFQIFELDGRSRLTICGYAWILELLFGETRQTITFVLRP